MATRAQAEAELAALGLRLDPEATIRLKATIKAHGSNPKTGEPETVIQRPAVA